MTSYRYKYICTLIALLIVITIFSNTAGAISGVSAFRIINGSSPGVPGYEPGDVFTVEVNYSVTGTSYLVTIKEDLPQDWEVLESTEKFTRDPASNIIKWNITSPLSGVSSGAIKYLVKIPETASGTYEISGETSWYESYDGVKNNVPSGTSSVGISTVNVISDEENNGPAIWIYEPEEMSGDGDEHLENMETAYFEYMIIDDDVISSYTVYINGHVSDSATGVGSTEVSESSSARMTVQPGMRNIIKIVATDLNGHVSEFSRDIYVPYYNNEAWMKVEWNGMEAGFAVAGMGSSATDGNWTFLHGGNQLQFPHTTFSYSGPAAINKYYSFGGISYIPGLNTFSGSMIDLDATPKSYREIPFETYPVYVEGNDSENDVTAYFMGSPDMSYQYFNVSLLDLTLISDKIDFTDASTIKQSIKGLSFSDISGSLVRSTGLRTNGTGDLEIDGNDIPELNNMAQGYYALVIMDYNLPNTPSLISAAPIFVAKYDMSMEQVINPERPAPMPGDPITYTLSLDPAPSVSPSKKYVYITAMIPESEYSAAFDLSTDGTASGTTLDFNGFSLIEKFTMSSEGREFYIDGLATHEMISTDTSISELKDMFFDEINASDIAMVFGTTENTENVDLVLQTKASMPQGRYVVIGAVIERDTGRLAALEQTDMYLGITTYTLNLKQGWNLVSIPVILDNKSIYSVFPGDTMNNISMVWEYDSSETDPANRWSYFTTKTDVYEQGSLTSIDERLGYWVKCYYAMDLTLQGVLPEEDTVILNTGWNLVGNPTLTDRNVHDVYGSAKMVWEYDSLEPDANNRWSYFTTKTDVYEQGSLTTLRAGYGYWVKIE
ncbi:hypothetical protein CUJ83_07745 [Methanocella sp. CWC-04]|uniref:Uncharacterized protein n=1 Tax=Methanooceanicella nereidis TaxID=2052831 RepID=A0AAP2RC97_9EURY|nr:TIGR04279 domain-containing protein [Methanocella sp. CWC-04]MCD1294889.1 hypothetical protein [Methanocella sp. CWC-04]